MTRQRPTTEEMLGHIRKFPDLSRLPHEILYGWCQFFGLSGRGAKDELIKRLTKYLRECGESR